MGLFGSRTKNEAPLRPEQKWDAISLQDFHSKSFWNGLAFGYLYFNILISFAVYGVDTFTAVNLLVFDRWSGSIKPGEMIVPREIAKWIFSVCIILSFLNLGYEHLRAFRVRKRGSVAECYLDSLAVRLESARPGKGQGWQRFLVFAALTKSKKGAEYVALFTYFSFQTWVRVIICEGPRQFVNATTLLDFYNSKLVPNDVSTVESTLESFFAKIDTLYRDDTQQALILSAMLFTLVIWVFSALYLIIAALFYVFFLWHYVPKADGGLHGYCERKINKRLMRIVTKKINKALFKDEQRQRKTDVKTAMKNGEELPASRQATLPTLLPQGDDKLPEMPGMVRSDTGPPLPPYTSRPATPQGIEMSAFDRPMPPSRTATTMSTVSSSSSRAPLLRNASPAPSVPALPPMGYNQYAAPPPIRPGSSASNRSMQSSHSQLSRIATSGPGFGGPGGPGPMPYTSSPAPYSSVGTPGPGSGPAMPAPIRSPTGPMGNYGRPMPRPGPPMDGRSSPASSIYSNQGPPPTSRPVYNGPSYNPMRSNTNPISPLRQQFPGQQQFPPQRNMTAPMPGRQQPGGYGPYDGPSDNYDMDVESQRGPRW